MEVILGKTSGFCQGVSYTVSKAYESLEDGDTLYCLGEIVHNEKVVENLNNLGMVFVDDIKSIPNGSRVIIRAHGEKKEVYDTAKHKNLDVIDLTCGKIRVIKNKIIKAKEKSFIIIIGKKNHPETLGTLSFCDYGYIVESPEDIEAANNAFITSQLDSIYIVSQTTFNEETFDYLVELIKKEIEANIVVDNTICNATHERQEETREIASAVDAMIIVGGKNSSNTKELYNVAKERCVNVYLIQDASEITDDMLNGIKKIGVMAGASTPKEVIEEVIANISK